VPSMPHSQTNTTRHNQHQAPFYRECDLKQDLSIATAKVSNLNSINSSNGNHSKSNLSAAVAAANASTNTAGQYPWIHRHPPQQQPQEYMIQQTPIQKIEARIAQMTMEDYAKEKIVLLLTGIV
ncbi:hypothetical protein BGZ80_005749, partial [Entomortierella chlamydospora]